MVVSVCHCKQGNKNKNKNKKKRKDVVIIFIIISIISLTEPNTEPRGKMCQNSKLLVAKPGHTHFKIVYRLLFLPLNWVL